MGYFIGGNLDRIVSDQELAAFWQSVREHNEQAARLFAAKCKKKGWNR